MELDGFALTEDAARLLSRGTESVSFFRSFHPSPPFTWNRNGEQIAWLDPGYPEHRSGSELPRLVGILDDLGFALGDPDPDPPFRERTMAHMARLTGVRMSASLLHGLTFRCAVAPDGDSWDHHGVDLARTAPIIAEGQARLAAYAGAGSVGRQ